MAKQEAKSPRKMASEAIHSKRQSFLLTAAAEPSLSRDSLEHRTVTPSSTFLKTDTLFVNYWILESFSESNHMIHLQYRKP